MAGWSITIIRQAPEDYPLKLDRDAVLASWKVGAMGTNWIEALVERGAAQCLQMGGYPNLYTALTGSVVPLLLGNELPSGEDVPMRRPHEITIRRDMLMHCLPDEMLTIVVWDQS
jgi:hypothetical protein